MYKWKESERFIKRPSLAESLRMYKELQKRGLVPPDYNLASPYGCPYKAIHSLDVSYMNKAENCECCGRDLPLMEICEYCGHDNHKLHLSGRARNRIRNEIMKERLRNENI